MAKHVVYLLLVLTLVRSSLAQPKLLLFLLDGVRYDYISEEALESLPGFKEIVNRGVKVDYLTPDFPSLSYPNYYTLMTGEYLLKFSVVVFIRAISLKCCTQISITLPMSLDHQIDLTSFLCMLLESKELSPWWPRSPYLLFNSIWSSSSCFFWCRHCEVHQMTGNYMWDPVTNLSFDIGMNPDSLLPVWWDGSEPLWVTMTKAKRKVSMYYWPGCEVEILGIRPNYCIPYENVPTDANFSNAVNNAIESLSNGAADMAAIYYERIDVEGHRFGPSSYQRKNAVKAVDNVLLRMSKLIKDKNLQNDLNVVFFSDHGMTDIYWMDKVIELKNCINMSDVIKVKDRGPVVSLWPEKGKENEIYNKLKNVPHMTVYRKEDIPDRFYYKKGKFVSPLTLVAEERWFIVENRESLPFWDNGTGKREAWQNGWHGYDNEFLDMRGIFFAYGPDFKSNFRAAPIRSVDVYNVMCKIAGIPPLPNNGSWSRVACMLKDNANLALSFQWSSSVLGLILFSLFV